MLLLIATLAAFPAGGPCSAEAKEVIVVKSADLKPYQDVLRGFRDACGCDAREIKLSNGEGLAGILSRKPEAVVAIGTSVFKKVRMLTDLPIVYTMVVPSEAALSQNRNLSGVSMDISPQVYLSTMLEMFPAVKRVGLLYDPRHTAEFVEAALKASQAAGIELVTKQVHAPSAIPAALQEMREKLDVFWMVPDSTLVTPEMVDYLLLFSFQHNLPVFSFSKKYLEQGAIASLDVDPYDMGVQAGEIVKRLSAGDTGAIRVYARKYRLTINAKVAAKLGLKIGDEILKKAANVE